MAVEFNGLLKGFFFKMYDSKRTISTVRVMTSDDLSDVLAWRNHPEIRRYMYTKHEISVDEHNAWFERASKDSNRHLLIFEVSGVAQGFVSFIEQSDSAVADWGFYIAPDAVRGTGRQLGLTALDYAFKILRMDKICGQALEFNERSVKFHRGLGFQQEGILRDQHYDGENHYSVICFGLLRTEWLPQT